MSLLEKFAAVDDYIGEIDGSDPLGGDGLMDVVARIINVVIGIVALVAVVMLIVGGVSYTTSAGGASKVKKAKDTILYGIIGVVVALLAFAIVNFVIGGVLGS